MGYQVIKQPDDRYAVWSTISDSLIIRDAAAHQVVNWYTNQIAKAAEEEMKRIVRAVGGGQAAKIYHQFVMTWEEALEASKDDGHRHGD